LSELIVRRPQVLLCSSFRRKPESSSLLFLVSRNAKLTRPACQRNGGPKKPALNDRSQELDSGFRRNDEQRKKRANAWAGPFGSAHHHRHHRQRTRHRIVEDVDFVAIATRAQ